MFRDTLESVRRAIELKIDPNQFFRKPTRYWTAPFTALRMKPRKTGSAAVTKNKTAITRLPQLVSWPKDAGGFVTLPQVYSEDACRPGLGSSNLGMYRIQLTGNQYQPDKEIGLHYQIHRSIGVHHQAAIDAGKPFHVNIFVGGSPAMTLSAVMPLPEGMSELTFAGALAGHRIPMLAGNQDLPIYADADFCICGTVDPERLLPEGPFGDHLGYYSLAHDFPVLKINAVYHRDDAIWPFTVVGRPPQEDTIFGELIHELTGPIIPTVLPGVKAVHAVDAAGVHPLLLAIGSERYTPYRQDQHPQELLTQANAILGQGQLSLAKYLFIMEQGCDPKLDIHDIRQFLVRMLERVDWNRDLHFQTKTTIDTLDYSGSGFNQGSKLVVAAAGPARRELGTELSELKGLNWPAGYGEPFVALPGVLVLRGPKLEDAAAENTLASWIATHWADGLATQEAELARESFQNFPLVVLVDDSEFAAATLNNWLWTVFTKSDPAQDIYAWDGRESVENKHWGSRGSLLIDARTKSRQAPPLVEDPAVTKKVDQRATTGDELAKYLDR